MKRIEQMYAFIAENPEDDMEGITAFAGPDGMLMPMVGANTKRVQLLRPLASQIANVTGNRITLCRFEVRTELETFDPEDGG